MHIKFATFDHLGSRSFVFWNPLPCTHLFSWFTRMVPSADHLSNRRQTRPLQCPEILVRCPVYLISMFINDMEMTAPPCTGNPRSLRHSTQWVVGASRKISDSEAKAFIILNYYSRNSHTWAWNLDNFIETKTPIFWEQNCQKNSRCSLRSGRKLEKKNNKCQTAETLGQSIMFVVHAAYSYIPQGSYPEISSKTFQGKEDTG